MADVLGELFSDIANSIRVGLGTIDEMAPTAFPGKIDKIVELLQNAGTGGGGSGGTEGSSLKIKSGNFQTDANGSRAEVAHGLGTMPDLVIVYIAGWYELEEIQNTSGRYLLYTWAIKNSFDTSSNSHGGYAIPGFHTANANALNEKSDISVYCPNDDVFQLGNADTTANGRLMPDTKYFWMAFSGLGAGNSADLRYVTFKSDDGTVEYGKKPVAVGDDCADPIARGIFSTPTKASTAQYSYTFAGWATTPGGGINSNALKAVNEDRTVYASFASVLRYYTITYYDSDGVTVLKTESLAYGAMPSYTPEKDGYQFSGWSPALSAVTGSASYTAQFIENVELQNASWETIAAKSADGTASQMWKVGDTKTFTCNGYTLTAKIAGFKLDTLANGTDKAGITFVVNELYSVKQQYHTDTSYSVWYEWDVCSLRTYCNSTIFDGLQEDLQAVVKTINKRSYGKDSSSPKITQDKCWLLSKSEVCFSTPNSGDVKYGDLFSDNASRIREKYAAAQNWLLRDLQAQNNASCVASNGALGYTSFTTKAYFIFGFCI